jgi:spermidine synthase
VDKVSVPEGVCGSVKIERFTVTEEEAARSLWRHRGRNIAAGEYTRLLINKDLIMSDTPAEMRDHRRAVNAAHGNCLVGGLGLGMVVQAMLQKKDVTKVTVIEKNPDVIALVARFYKEKFGERLEVIEGDVNTWEPPAGTAYDVVWMDIWGDVSTDNLKEMEFLKEKFSVGETWVGCWFMGYLEDEVYGPKCPDCWCRGEFHNGSCAACGYEEDE